MTQIEKRGGGALACLAEWALLRYGYEGGTGYVWSVRGVLGTRDGDKLTEGNETCNIQHLWRWIHEESEVDGDAQRFGVPAFRVRCVFVR